MNAMLELIGREVPLFEEDLRSVDKELIDIVKSSRFLILGGAGTIGQAVTKEIFRRNPKVLHVVDISENNLVELVRDLRSSIGYGDGDFATFALDIGSDLFDSFMRDSCKYDYIFNLSALKHVRSEKDPYTLMRMIDVNIYNTEKTLIHAKNINAKKYFCVSTDKAANPVNMMGASKRIMEMFLSRHSVDLDVSTARFANVAFSDGSLLHGFNRRMEKGQPLSAPNDVRRYFVTPQESGELCLLSGLLGSNMDIYFPKLDHKLNLITFSDIAERYLHSVGYESIICQTEEEARQRVVELKKNRQWPVYFFASDTTGEKDFEEFYTNNEILDLDKFKTIGIVKNKSEYNLNKLNYFNSEIKRFRSNGCWSRGDLVELFNNMIDEFNHKETGKFLDGRM